MSSGVSGNESGLFVYRQSMGALVITDGCPEIGASTVMNGQGNSFIKCDILHIDTTYSKYRESKRKQ